MPNAKPATGAGGQRWRTVTLGDGRKVRVAIVRKTKENDGKGTR